MRTKKVFWVCVHILVGVLFVALFGKFNRLRTVDVFHLYKEYLSGCILLLMLSINDLVLFPVFFKTMRVRLYLLYAVAVATMACLSEMLLVSSDVLHILQMQFSLSEAKLFFLSDCLYVLFRDILLVGFSFTLMALHYYAAQNCSKEVAMAHDMHVLEATLDDKDRTVARIKIKNVSYIFQNKNVTFFWLTNGNRAQRYGSMKRLLKILDEDCYVQISGNILAICNNIVRYDSTGVVVKVTSKNVLLPYSESFREQAMNKIYERTGLEPQMSRDSRGRQIHQNIENRHRQKLQSEKLIYAFIAEHPDCSATEIKKNRSLSQSTVNRILKQLKDEGLIQYVGSKKTGGYRVVEKE